MPEEQPKFIEGLTNDQLIEEQRKRLRDLAELADRSARHLEHSLAVGDPVSERDIADGFRIIARMAREGLTIHAAQVMPVFVLKPTDPTAPAFAEAWLAAWKNTGRLSAEKAASARSTINAMREWQEENKEKMHEPD